jgi:hypothetical protein
MTNDQLGAFVDWMKSQRHADFAVWTYPAADGWQALADRWQTTAVNLRQIRSRAKKKIEDYIAEHEGD